MLTRGMCIEIGIVIIFKSMVLLTVISKLKINPSVSRKQRIFRLVVQTYSSSPLGKSKELISATVFFTSKASDFVNGHLFVDGGMLAAV